MTTGSFADMNCPIAQTLERVGERWTLLILRNAFCGMSRFDQFQQHLGIGSNILARRLRSLTAEGILTRSPAPDDGRAIEYRLTEKGAALFPVLIALTEWGERFVPHRLGARLTLVERANGQPISGIRVLALDGRALQAHDIAATAGPGADEGTHTLAAHSLAAAVPSSHSK